uniref:Creatinase_N domain-containing protein n=1 Tax=Steinernema glaseri TaxID=37863 RepID=A0A1I7ZW36_9BILA
MMGRKNLFQKKGLMALPGQGGNSWKGCTFKGNLWTPKFFSWSIDRERIKAVKAARRRLLKEHDLIFVVVSDKTVFPTGATDHWWASLYSSADQIVQKNICSGDALWTLGFPVKLGASLSLDYCSSDV